MNNYYDSSFEIKSNAQYKDISSVNFTPVTEIEIQKKYSKGEWRFWKWLGLIPLIPYKVREDLYKSDYWDGLKTFKKARDYHYSWFGKDGKIYNMAEVYVKKVSGNNDCNRFKSNKEATEFIQNLKDRCREAGNELK